MRVVIEGCTLELCRGDITRESTDAIVNAANSSLLGGGGVDGAIHRAGGPAILEACRAIRAARGALPTGQAVITPAGALAARHVIHTVGPVWQGGDAGEEELLRSCYRSCLELAREHGLRRIAFPSISTGAYRFPVRKAARVALETVSDELAEHPAALELARFVLFDEATLEAYTEALTKLRTIALSPS
jgi:O-acetyl-ADP-ribose deacetylase (regulator of RNase III)